MSYLVNSYTCPWRSMFIVSYPFKLPTSLQIAIAPAQVFLTQGTNPQEDLCLGASAGWAAQL